MITTVLRIAAVGIALGFAFDGFYAVATGASAINSTSVIVDAVVATVCLIGAALPTVFGVASRLFDTLYAGLTAETEVEEDDVHELIDAIMYISNNPNVSVEQRAQLGEIAKCIIMRKDETNA